MSATAPSRSGSSILELAAHVDNRISRNCTAGVRCGDAQVERLHGLVTRLLVEVLRGHVCYVLCSGDVVETSISYSTPVLNPSASGCQLADAAEAAPPAYLDHCCRARMHLELQTNAEVLTQSFGAKAFASSPADPAELGLGQTQRNGRLACRAAFYDVTPDLRDSF